MSRTQKFKVPGLLLLLPMSVLFGFTLSDPHIHDSQLLFLLPVFAHDGDGDGIDDDTLLPVVDEASSDPFPNSATDFRAILNSSNIVGPTSSNSTFTGTAEFFWSENQERLRYTITLVPDNPADQLNLNDVTEDTVSVVPRVFPSSQFETVTKVHIHIGDSSTNGPHALNIFGIPAHDDLEMRAYSDRLEITGVYGDIDTGTLGSDAGRSKQLSDMREELCGELLYLQIHTTWSDELNAQGAIRGQIEVQSELCNFNLAQAHFTSTINGAQVIPPSTSPATGTAQLYFSPTRDSLYYRIDLNGVDIFRNGTATTDDDLIAIHIHRAAAGANGPHALNIFGRIVPSLPSIMNATNGHNHCDVDTGPPFNAVCDDAQMEIRTVNDGTGITITGVYDDSDRTAQSGLSEPGRSKFLSDMIGELCADELYFQAHTPGGNIRGQINLAEITSRSELMGITNACEFDPNRNDFTAVIDSAQITPDSPGPSNSNATGTANLRFNERGDKLHYEINLVGLDADQIQTLQNEGDDLTAIHFHHAAAGVYGPVHLLNIFGVPSFDDANFVNIPGNGTIIGIWDDADETRVFGNPNAIDTARSKKLSDSISALCNEHVFINVHTEQFRTGDVRGQIVPTPDNIICEFDKTQPPDFIVTSINAVNLNASGGISHANNDTGFPVPNGSAEFFFNDDKTKLHYVIDFENIDTTGEQTVRTHYDNMRAIHIHFGYANGSGSHAYNIISPDGDPNDLRINNGTTVVSGVWDPTDPVGIRPVDSVPLAQVLDNLCDENLYLQSHLSLDNSRNIRGQIIPGPDSNVCDPPSLVYANLVTNNQINLLFSHPLNSSSLSTGDFTSLELFLQGASSATTYSITNANVFSNNAKLVTLTFSPAIPSSSSIHNGTLQIQSSLTSDMGTSFNTNANPISISDALGNTPLSLGTNTPEIIISDQSVIPSQILVQENTEAILNFEAIAESDDRRRITVTLPRALNVTSVERDVTVDVHIPANTDIVGNEVNFNSRFTLPTILQGTECPANFDSNELVNSCVQIGTPDARLSLNNPAKITLTGQSGATPFYANLDIPKTEVTAVCDGANTPTVDGTALGTNQQCFINDGNDLVIWTRHFSLWGSTTTFATPNTASSSGGGGKSTTLLHSNLIMYNNCDPTQDGLVRVVTSHTSSVNQLQVNVHAKDATSYGVDVTAQIPASTYLSVMNPNRAYAVFDASLPAGAEQFFVTVSDESDVRKTTSRLVPLQDASCADAVYPNPSANNAGNNKALEPIDRTTMSNLVQQLTAVVPQNDINIDIPSNTPATTTTESPPATTTPAVQNTVIDPAPATIDDVSTTPTTQSDVVADTPTTTPQNSLIDEGDTQVTTTTTITPSVVTSPPSDNTETVPQQQQQSVIDTPTTTPRLSESTTTTTVPEPPAITTTPPTESSLDNTKAQQASSTSLSSLLQQQQQQQLSEPITTTTTSNPANTECGPGTELVGDICKVITSPSTPTTTSTQESNDNILARILSWFGF